MPLLFIQEWVDSAAGKALAWTLLHSLWQGLIVALLAAFIIMATRKSSAKWRYNLLGLLMILFLVSTGITFYKSYQSAITDIPEFQEAYLSPLDNTDDHE